MRWYFAAVLLALWVVSVNAEEADDPYFHLGFGVMNDAFMALPENSEGERGLIPVVSAGIGYDSQLSAEWSVSTHLSVSYASTDVLINPSQSMPLATSVDNTGVWAGSTLKYNSLFDGARPFISVEVGKVYGEFTVPTERVSGWETGYRAFTGVEFDVGNGSAFSVGFGVADTGDINQ